jgi:hypothetical protein
MSNHRAALDAGICVFYISNVESPVRGHFSQVLKPHYLARLLQQFQFGLGINFSGPLM